MNNQNNPESIDKNRRKLLAVMLVGSGTFLVEKFLGPIFSKFLKSPSTKVSASDHPLLGNFKVLENKNSLSFHDNSGEEVFQIDKEV